MGKLGTALVGSLALHGLVVLAVNLPALIPLPKSPLEIEVLPYERPKPKPVELPPQPPEPPRPPPPKRVSVGKPKPGESPTPKAAPATPPPPSTANLRPYAPSNVNLILILRCDRIRSSPHAEFTDAVLASLPDYESFLGGTGLTAVRDFDALLIASADPHLVTETFLAARAKPGTPIQKLSQRALHPGDPRIVRVLSDDLAVLGKPEALGQPTDLGVSPQSQWLGQLDKILDHRSDAPAVLATINDLDQLVRLGNLPTPHDLELAVTADAGPAIRLVARFGTDGEAAAFAQLWPKLVADYKQSTRYLGIGALFDGLTATVDKSRVEIAGRLPETATRLAFIWLRSMLPKPKTPLAPPDAGAPRDLGHEPADLQPE